MFYKNKPSERIKTKSKALWVDEELHDNILALAAFKQKKIQDLVSNMLRKAIRDEIDKHEFTK